jgi:signal transduction histidine kinase/HAMP domain-containing protein/ActR/RegA family two-component response regulator
MRSGRTLTVRAMLILVGFAGLGYAGAIAYQLVRVVRPAATDLQGRTRDLLSDHDLIASNLQHARSLRREIALHVPPVPRDAAPPRAVTVLEGEARALVDAGASIRASVDRSEVPFEMRTLLAEAVEEEAAVAISLVEALRAVELGQPTMAADALRRSGIRSDSSGVLLRRAQAVALEDLLVREERLGDRLRALVDWALVWAIAGAVLFAAGAWIVRQRLYRPVREMEATVQRIAAGDLTAEVPVRRLDELGLLAAHLNAMTTVLRDRAVEETRRRESLTERFGRILDASSNEICVFDAATLRLIQANRGARAHLSPDEEQLQRLTLPELFAAVERGTLEAHLDHLRRGAQPRVFLSTRFARRDGTSYPVEVTIQYLTEGDGGVFVTVSEDAGIRGRVRALDQRLRDFALTEQATLLRGDLHAALLRIGPMAADALRAENVEVWRSDGSEERCLAAWDQRRGELVEGEALAAMDRDRASAWLSVPIQMGGRTRTELTFDPGAALREWSAEEEAFARSIAELVARAMEASERRGLEAALARAQRMDSIGQLAGGVAHDFNNILTAILGNLEACRSDLRPGDPLDSALAEAEQAARRAADLTKQLLTFARHQLVETRLVDINAQTRDADRMLRRLLGASIDVQTNLAPTVRPVRLGAGQFEQVLMNLAVNARDAMPGGGIITIQSRDLHLGAAEVEGRPGLTAGDFVELTVTDTGAGMPRETMERVFEPFYTTKGLGEGTGLGLAVCYGIVRQAGGDITVASAPGRGTTFTVRIPAAPGVVEPDTGSSQKISSGGTETLLVVEDERMIRELVVRALRARGYQVLQAADGKEALEVAAAHEGEIDLLLSDVVMPRMGGPEAARRLKEERPDLRCLFMSGYPAEQMFGAGAPEGSEFVPKPLTPDEVCRRIRTLLDRDGTPVAMAP